MTEDSIPTADTEPEPAAPRRMVRTMDGRILAGVCTGLGRYTGIDPVVFRVGFGLLFFASGWGVLLYIAAALLMPVDPSRPAPAEQVLKRRLDGDAVLALLGVLLGVGVLVNLPGWSLQTTLTALVVFAFALLVAQSRGVNLVQAARTLPERLQGTPPEAFAPSPSAPPAHFYSPLAPGGLPPGAIDLAALNLPPRGPSTPTPPPQDANPYDTRPSDAGPYDPPPYDSGPYDTAPAQGGSPGHARAKPRLTGLTLLLALATAAVTGLVLHGRPGYPTTEITLAAALAVVGAGLVISTWYGRSRGLVAVGALLSIGLVATSVPGGSVSGGRFGEVVWRPAEVGSGEQTYKVIAGDGRLDLTRLPLQPGQRVRIHAELGAGQIIITVPASAQVELRATAGLGDIVIDHRTVSGPRAKANEVLQPEVVTANPPVIELSVRGRVGDVQVRRA